MTHSEPTLDADPPTPRGGDDARPPRRRRRRIVLIGVLGVALVAAGTVGGFVVANRLHKVTTGCSLNGVAAQPGGAEREFRFAPEQLANASAIASVALRRNLPGRALTIAYAVAMQESKLRNLNYGDRDSLGIFQQRPSQGWGTAAQVQNPEFAAGKFFDSLVKVKDWQNRPVTEVAQAVQRSGYPEAYAGWEPRGAALAAVFTGQSPGAVECRIAGHEPGTAPAAVHERLTHDLPAGTATVTTLADGQAAVRVTDLDAADAIERPWSVAAWGVAHTEALGVTEVWVAGQRWRASDGKWRPADQAQATASGEVVFVLAPVTGRT